jgi:hypothetical protein
LAECGGASRHRGTDQGRGDAEHHLGRIPFEGFVERDACWMMSKVSKLDRRLAHGQFTLLGRAILALRIPSGLKEGLHNPGPIRVA